MTQKTVHAGANHKIGTENGTEHNDSFGGLEESLQEDDMLPTRQESRIHSEFLYAEDPMTLVPALIHY